MSLARTLLILALAAPSLAWGQALDPPERIARLTYVEGELLFQTADEPATATLPDRSLLPGDRIQTEPDGRAEIVLGTAMIRLDEQSELAIVDLDAGTVRVELTRGTANVNLGELLENEAFEIVTPNAAITLEEPGEYRADVFDSGSTALTVREGAASVDTAGGPVRVAAGQRVQLEGRNALARLETPRPADAFDDWVLERELKLAEAEPRYTPYEEGGEYEELDRYGEWYDEPRYGRVWMPSYGYSGWSPYYGGGYWQPVGYGYGWVDPAPWGYFAYYSGRWTYLDHLHRWCWVPRQRIHAAQVARDTRLAAVPGRNIPVRVTPETAPRTADRRPTARDVSEPVVPVRSTPRHNEADRRPVRVRADAADAPPAQGRQVTMRPSRADHARSEATPDSKQGRRESDAWRTP